MFIGNSQKRTRYLSSPVYRCRVWWIQNWLQFEQHSDSVSSISSVKNSPANAIKISCFFLAVAYKHCVTIKQTVIQAGRQVYHVNPFFEQKIQGAWCFHDTLILTCLYKFLFVFIASSNKSECTLVSVIVSGKLIELASSTIGQRAKSRQRSGHKAIKETEKPF